jgi:Skp family chaperone for outer membrane proteins
MNKVRILTIAVIILGGINLFFLLAPLFHEHPKSPKDLIINSLDFDNQQQKAYEKLIQEHQSNTERIHKEISQARKELYANLSAKKRVDLTDAYQNLTNAQLKMEKNHYKHFVDIRDLCNEDQLPKFDKLVKEINDIFSPPRKRKK